MAGHASADLLMVLDFDRTIFDTHRYYQDFLAMLKAEYSEAVAQDMRLAEASNKYFDPFAHLIEQGVSYEEVTAAFLRFREDKYGSQAEGSYLFPDATEFIAEISQRPHTKLAIITTGTLMSQRFKLSLCPQLESLPAMIIPGNKGIHLQQDIDAHAAVLVDGTAYQRIALVDDRDDVLAHIRPHQGHQLFHIVRPGSKYQPTISRSDIREITSLTDITEFLD